MFFSLNSVEMKRNIFPQSYSSTNNKSTNLLIDIKDIFCNFYSKQL